MKKINVLWSVVSLLLVSLPVLAETTVTVSNTQQAVPQTIVIRQAPVVVATEQIVGDLQGRIVEINTSQNLIVVHSADGKDWQVPVTQGTVNNYRLGDYVQIRPTVAPMIITQEAVTGDFEGRITEVNYAQSLIIVRDINNKDRQVMVRSDIINNYRVGDYVRIRPMTDLTVITMEENPKEFEGEIIRVDIPRNMIVVQDTNGRERKVQMKQGMIGSYKVDDYVRIHLMADLKEALTIETVRDIGRLDGSVVSVDPQGSRMVVRDSHGNERTVIVRQGMITNYRIGNQVRVYQLSNREDVQLIRMIRVS